MHIYLSIHHNHSRTVHVQKWPSHGTYRDIYVNLDLILQDLTVSSTRRQRKRVRFLQSVHSFHHYHRDSIMNCNSLEFIHSPFKLR